MGIYIKLGKKIKEARMAAGYNQEELASMLNLNRVSIVNMEKGRQKISLDKLIVISKLTGYSIASMLKDIGINDDGQELPKADSYEFALSLDLHKEFDRIPEKIAKRIPGMYLTMKKLITDDEKH